MFWIINIFPIFLRAFQSYSSVSIASKSLSTCNYKKRCKLHKVRLPKIYESYLNERHRNRLKNVHLVRKHANEKGVQWKTQTKKFASSPTQPSSLHAFKHSKPYSLTRTSKSLIQSCLFEDVLFFDRKYSKHFQQSLRSKIFFKNGSFLASEILHFWVLWGL